MKFTANIVALLLTVSLCPAAEKDSYLDDLSPEQIKIMVQSEFPNIDDKHFEELYRKHRSYEDIWKACHSPSKPLNQWEKPLESSSLDSEISKLSSALEEAQKNADQVDQQIQKGSSESSELKAKMLDLQKRMSVLEQTITSMYPEKNFSIRDIEENILEAESTIKFNTEQIDFYRRAVSERLESKARFQRKIDEIASEVKEKRSEIERLVAENNKLITENEVVHQQILTNIRSGNYDCSSLERKKEQNILTRRSNTEKIGLLKSGILSLQETVRSYEGLIRDIEAYVRELTSNSADRQKEIDQIKANLVKLKASLVMEKERQAEQVKVSSVKLKEYQQTLIGLQGDYQVLAKRFKEITEELQRLSRLKQAHQLKLEALRSQRHLKVEERKLNVFNLVKQQLQSISRLYFDKFYELENGSTEQIVKNIVEKLKVQAKEEQEDQERFRQKLERIEQERKLEEARQQSLSQDLRLCLLNGDSLENVKKITGQLKSLAWTWNKDNSTLLHFAVEGGKRDLVQHILQFANRGISVNSLLSNGESPLHRAAFLGHAEIAQDLIKHGANVFHKTSEQGVSVLEAALNYLEGCVDQEKWDRLGNAFTLIGVILDAMKKPDDSQSGSFPSPQPILLLIKRVCDKIGKSNIEEERRKEETRRLQEYENWIRRLVILHEEYLAKKKQMEEKQRREEELRRQQQTYTQPRYAYRY